MAYCSRPLLDDSQFSCPICMEIMVNPIRISCCHMFCKHCISNLTLMNGGGLCPMCRAPFRRTDVVPDSDVEMLINSSSGVCETCGVEVLMSELRVHSGQCIKSDQGAYSQRCKPVRKRSPPADLILPNRQTFKCPYCSLDNLDFHGIVMHCNTIHRQCRDKVVCPICTSMPWGNAQLKSRNFIEHLNLRHQFEYDNYVDYSLDDDEMLTATVETSRRKI